jgi:acyl-CoA thioester hydrolase
MMPDAAHPAAPPVAAGHLLRVTVYWEDTDASGIVYHASYLRFAERARTEMLRAAGIAQGSLLAGAGIAFAVRRCTIDYLAPARLDDVLEVVSRVSRVRGASIAIDQRILREGAVLARLSVTVACLDRRGRPARLPAPLRVALARLAAPATIET